MDALINGDSRLGSNNLKLAFVKEIQIMGGMEKMASAIK
jgi:hypothetical protein